MTEAYSKEIVAVYSDRLSSVIRTFLDAGLLDDADAKLAKGALGTLKALGDAFRQVPLPEAREEE